MKQEAARTRINRETQHVARKMQKLLRHERPHWRMDSVTLRGLDVTCHFRLDQSQNLPVNQCQDLSSKPAARGIEIGTHNHTVTATNQYTRTQTHSERNEERSRPHTHLKRDARCGAEDVPIVTPRKTTSTYGIGDRLGGLM